MKEKKPDIREGRMIHIRLSDSIHQRLRVRVAELDTTMQDWVEALIEAALKRPRKEG